MSNKKFGEASISKAVSSPSEPDIVGMYEIAQRIGISYNRVHTWAARDALGEPSWRLECGQIWKWDTVKASEPCARALGANIWIHLIAQLPRSPLVELDVAQGNELQAVTRRIDRNGGGWLSWPTQGVGLKRRVVITDSVSEGGRRFQRRSEAAERCHQLAVGMRPLFLAGDTRDPAIGGSWKSS